MISQRLLSGFYLLLKFTFRLAFRIYYPNTVVLNADRFRLTGPTLLVTNHPNTLIDALNAASRASRQVHFLVNSGLYQSAFSRWLFNTLYCIPVKRAQDPVTQTVNNQDSFARCKEHLTKGGHLFIAPEGTSIMERRLKKMKSGLARIALDAESKNDFTLGLRILPIGLNYEQPNRFGTRLLVNVGDPILVSEWESAFRTDPRNAIRELTGETEQRLRRLIIDTTDEEEDRLIRYLEILDRNTDPASEAAHFHRIQDWIPRLRQQKVEDPESWEIFCRQVNSYFETLKSEKLDDSMIARPAQRTGWEPLLLAGGFPLFGVGLLNHIFPAGLPLLLVKWTRTSREYETTARWMSAMITFPLFYFLQYGLASLVFGPVSALFYFLGLPVTGWLAWKYWIWARKTTMCLRFAQLQHRNPEWVRERIEERRRIGMMGMMEKKNQK